MVCRGKEFRRIGLGLVANLVSYYLLLLLSLSFVSITVAETTNQTSRTALKRLDQGVEKFTLSNGLRVIFFRRENAPVFAGQTWVGVGGVDEVEGKTGAAHLLEHMAFKGSETIGTKSFAAEKPLLDRLEVLMAKDTKEPGSVDKAEVAELYRQLSAIWVDNEFSRAYQRRGAVGLNAGTAKDYTMYKIELPSADFELWCWLESDRLLAPVFRQFYKERDVVMEERRMRTDDSPQGRLYEALMGLAYTTHPYRAPTIGYAKDIASLVTADTSQIFHTYYRPDNMVVVLVGDLDSQTVRQQTERYFGRLPRGQGELPKLTAIEPAQQGERRGEVTFDAEPQFFLGYHKPVFPDPADMHFSLLHNVLSEGRTSYFYRELIQDKQLALGASTTEGPGSKYPSLFIVSAAPRKGVPNEKLVEEIQSLFDRLAVEPLPAEVFQAAKRRVKVGFLGGLDSNDSLAETLGNAELAYGDWRSIFKMFDMIETAEPDDVQQLAKKYLRPENRTLVSLSKPAPADASATLIKGKE